ncbi:AbrB/MazE/SpoVT family DNA-binding domain-containing protein [Archaeoglobus veneficus]|uniref:SpoVT/AbrB domain-containing protein n=1 Tax=Archaeoglobus veneficus (strain DSM 11195 / SNP6) TaxID=693661 RepID=F2KND3_ARCVS|nr:AbrB/MazE/SpoVT family DNA-binding domain-containing protein [Archaeoglobus veneficus]AEA47335.1 SpoVT/AbrB domain-containing protein [Archaeoglobus veneficus SNP6]
MSYGVEIKKVDRQGRIILPSDWRRDELKNGDEVFIIKERGVLKIIPKKKKPDLTKYFDSVDLNVDFIEEWDKFEREFNEIP